MGFRVAHARVESTKHGKPGAVRDSVGRGPSDGRYERTAWLITGRTRVRRMFPGTQLSLPVPVDDADLGRVVPFLDDGHLLR